MAVLSIEVAIHLESFWKCLENLDRERKRGKTKGGAMQGNA